MTTIEKINQSTAAKAYDQAALKYHGEFAYLNFPDKVEKVINEDR